MTLDRLRRPRRSGPHHAHTLPDRPSTEWQSLVDHLTGVAARAGEFAGSIGAHEWGRWAGLAHDLGKFSACFQNYLATRADPDPHVADSAARTDHSTAGAQHAVETLGVPGHLLGYVIAGHHGGLLDGRAEVACQIARLSKRVETWRHGLSELPVFPAVDLPGPVREALSPPRDPFVPAFFTRLLYSCLVDADFLDTEAFMDPVRASARSTWPDDVLQRMAFALDVHVAGLGSRRGASRAVDERRRSVREACLAAAAHPPGLFSLTVPTGGGKTLSSLSFALRHAIRHGLHRVIYVVPFTSIIEQNAAVFREALAPLEADLAADPVLEHHFNVDVGEETVTSRLATENWDSPLVVTTAVQFYESLFANRPSRCRKLHNVARTVIVIDEAQTLPVHFLHPCLRAIRELTEHCGCTVVLCTATQPAVHRRPEFSIGLDHPLEIVPAPESLFRSLRRVRVKDIGRLDDLELARRLRNERQALCIVNTRGHARALFQAMGNSDADFHLSALMCPEHRSRVLSAIAARLRDGLECRVVSTQLIEAGVDVDFPVVYRALAGLDSIAQAAGRCNRNGLLGEGGGRTFIFRSEHIRAERFFVETANCGAEVLEIHDDPLSPEAVEQYFRLYYWSQSSRWDEKGILNEFELHAGNPALPFSFGFRRAAERFRIIEDGGAVIVPWGVGGRTLCDRLREPWAIPDRRLLRRLQRFTVQVPERIVREHLGRTIELVKDRYAVLISAEMNYSEETGLVLEGLDVPLEI